MSNAKPDLGEANPLGHPSGRVWPLPDSVEQAKARVTYQMGALEANCRDSIDIGYALQCFDEAVNDYALIVLETL